MATEVSYQIDVHSIGCQEINRRWREFSGEDDRHLTFYVVESKDAVNFLEIVRSDPLHPQRELLDRYVTVEEIRKGFPLFFEEGRGQTLLWGHCVHRLISLKAFLAQNLRYFVNLQEGDTTFSALEAWIGLNKHYLVDKGGCPQCRPDPADHA